MVAKSRTQIYYTEGGEKSWATAEACKILLIPQKYECIILNKYKEFCQLQQCAGKYSHIKYLGDA